MVLTQKDLDEIEQIIDEKIKFALKHLPSKDQFYKAMDKIEKIHPNYQHL